MKLSFTPFHKNLIYTSKYPESDYLTNTPDTLHKANDMNQNGSAKNLSLHTTLGNSNTTTLHGILIDSATGVWKIN